MKGTASTRQFWPRINTDPLAIISFHLDGMQDAPSHIVFHHLQPWLQGNLIHVDIILNFRNGKEEFESLFSAVLDKFEDSAFHEYVLFKSETYWSL